MADVVGFKPGEQQGPEPAADPFSVAALLFQLENMPGGIAGNLKELEILEEDSTWPVIKLKVSAPLLQLLQGLQNLG